MKEIKYIAKLFFSKNIKLNLMLGLSFILLMITIVANILTPLVFKDLLLNWNIFGASPAFFLLIITYSGVWSIKNICEQAREVLMFPVVERYVTGISKKLFNAYLQMSWLDFRRFNVGDLNNVFFKAREGLPYLIWGVIFFLLPTILEMIWVYGYLIYNVPLVYAFIFLLVFISSLVSSLLILKRSQPIQEKAFDTLSLLSQRTIDRLNNFLLIKLFNKEKAEFSSYETLLHKVETLEAKKKTTLESIRLSQAICFSIGLILLLVQTYQHHKQNIINLGDFLIIHGYFIQWMGPLSVFGFIIKEVQEGYINLKKALKFLLAAPAYREDIPSLPFHDKISLEDVHFKYESGINILQNISIEIPKGSKIGIVGSSGQGKTTLINIFNGLLHPTEGSIAIDSTHITKENIHALKLLISSCPQQPLLFDDTLWNNVSYANPGIDKEKVISLLEHSGLTSLLKKINYNLDVIIGPNGLEPSLGEKQRLCLVRGIIKPAEIYIFDEIESYLDMPTLNSIESLIGKDLQNKTIIRISHKLASLSRFDKIYVLKNGTIVESGKFEELTEFGMEFSRLYKGY